VFKKKSQNHVVKVTATYDDSDDIFAAMMEPSHSELLKIRGSLIPCDNLMGDYEPVKYEFCDACMRDATFLEDAEWVFKDAYRMKSALHMNVDAMVLDLDGVWHPMMLRPLLVRFSRGWFEPMGYGFKGVLPGYEMKSHDGVIPKSELDKKWSGKLRSRSALNQNLTFRYEVGLWDRLTRELSNNWGRARKKMADWVMPRRRERWSTW
jgi:hypothetical protein